MWALNVVIPDLVGDPLDVGVKGMRYEARGVSRHPHAGEDPLTAI